MHRIASLFQWLHGDMLRSWIQQQNHRPQGSTGDARWERGSPACQDTVAGSGKKHWMRPKEGELLTWEYFHLWYLVPETSRGSSGRNWKIFSFTCSPMTFLSSSACSAPNSTLVWAISEKGGSSIQWEQEDVWFRMISITHCYFVWHYPQQENEGNHVDSYPHRRYAKERSAL